MLTGRARRCRLALGVIALAVIVAVAGWIVWSRRYCACLETASTAQAIQALSQMDWHELDGAAVARLWPGLPALPCEQVRGSGLAGFVAAVERCCQTCSMCGGPNFLEVEERSLRGLRAIGVTLCGRSPTKVLGDLRRMVDAAVPPKPEAAFHWGGWTAGPSTQDVWHQYRWQSHGDTFILEARALADGERWMGSYELTRCSPLPTGERWTLDDGSFVDVLRSEVVEGEAKGQRDLDFSYLSRCLLADAACREAERQRLWPRVRTLAEQRGAHAVYLSTEACNRSSVGAVAKRTSDGRWDVPWSRGVAPREGP